MPTGFLLTVDPLFSISHSGDKSSFWYSTNTVRPAKRTKGELSCIADTFRLAIGSQQREKSMVVNAVISIFHDYVRLVLTTRLQSRA